VWFCKGLKEYTKGGFETASKRFNPTDLEVDCSGLSYMITGANSGIGKVAALEIAKRGGTIHMVCRNPQYAQEASKEIKEAATNNADNIHVHILDLSDPKAVGKFASEFKDPLNVLINNAGCMVNTRSLTSDNLEKNFATNTLGTFILTVKLLPKLKESKKSRVIIVSSGGMLTNKLNLDDLNFEKMNPFDGTMAYAQNKRQQVIMTEQLALVHPDVYFASMHPGWADTPAVRSAMPEFHDKMKNKLRTVEQGADTIVWLAISNTALEQQSGLFYQDREAVSTHLPLAWSRSSPEDCQMLMKKLDELSKKFT